MKLAIQGCSHGELDAIYASLLRTEATQSLAIDALLLCGDFQAIRNHSDLHALAVPQKYRQLGDFHAYYSGQKVAPILTLVIGGNHEASNYMHELYHGGWLAPNIYFLGAAGVVELNGLVIAGISGIYKEHDYRKGRFEKLPYDAGTIRSCYHTREFDVVRLKAMQSSRPNIVLSHDWPNTIEQWGNTQGLIRKKPFFKDEIETRTLGSPPLMELLQCLRPSFWFSAHLHVKFAALYNHDQPATSIAPNTAADNANPEAIDIDLESDTDEPQPPQEPAAVAVPSASTTNATAKHDTDGKHGTTRFLALHKCLPNTPFLQIIDHPSPHDSVLESRKAALQYQQRVPPTLRYNKRWLAITRAFHPHFSLEYRQGHLPDPFDPEFLCKIEEEERWIDQHLSSLNGGTKNSGKRKQDEPEGSRLATPESTHEKEEDGDGEWLDVARVQQFVRTAPAPFEQGGLNQGLPSWYTNPQTEAFCRLVGIENQINPRPKFHPPPTAQYSVPQPPHLRQPPPEHGAGKAQGMPSETTEADPNALAIDMDDLDSESECGEDHTSAEPSHGHKRDDGILRLSDEDELHARWKEGTG
ncbi:related to lariat-debranching enzyme [Ustilago trichophora]|uniref:Related to lariat-debranching enzyme n=1 Tax=Ustilago trichophora TaxID=86804 RepID=A0A5C3DW26_9BASI|nr:related to lariat-debranching enzyme [Ustilago trichophora]